MINEKLQNQTDAPEAHQNRQGVHDPQDQARQLLRTQTWAN